MTVDLNLSLEDLDEILNDDYLVFSPVTERHLRQSLTIGDYSLHNIRQGEEILCDYLSFVGDPEAWEEEVTSLRRQCSGEIMGDIAQYELECDDHELVYSDNSM
mmetsp:Transcript_21924/g.39167  ORF Transcript_21924/g.39167 Transcript_21924/m.39167 type:complete len:104 (-) Transcript_21924:192-503(-)